MPFPTAAVVVFCPLDDDDDIIVIIAKR